MTKVVLSIAKKEFLDNIRNYWILGFSLLFLAITLLGSYFGSILVGWQDLEGTIETIENTVVRFFIPIIGLMLGYASIVGEIERGSMSSLLSLPVTRDEVILGKFLGLGSVICSTILIGFGIAGIVIAANVPSPNYGAYLIFIGTSMLLGLGFLSISMLLSSIFKSRAAAMGGAIFTWVFFSIIWTFLIVGIAFYLMSDGSKPNMDLFYSIQLINPITAHSLIENTNIPHNVVVSYEHATLSLLLWTIVPLLTATWIFRRKEI